MLSVEAIFIPLDLTPLLKTAKERSDRGVEVLHQDAPITNHTGRERIIIEPVQQNRRLDDAQNWHEATLERPNAAKAPYFELLQDLPQDFPMKGRNESTKDYFVRVWSAIGLQFPVHKVISPNFMKWARGSSRFHVLQASRVIDLVCKLKLPAASRRSSIKATNLYGHKLAAFHWTTAPSAVGTRKPSRVISFLSPSIRYDGAPCSPLVTTATLAARSGYLSARLLITSCANWKRDFE